MFGGKINFGRNVDKRWIIMEAGLVVNRDRINRTPPPLGCPGMDQSRSAPRKWTIGTGWGESAAGGCGRGPRVGLQQILRGEGVPGLEKNYRPTLARSWTGSGRGVRAEPKPLLSILVQIVRFWCTDMGWESTESRAHL